MRLSTSLLVMSIVSPHRVCSVAGGAGWAHSGCQPGWQALKAPSQVLVAMHHHVTSNSTTCKQYVQHYSVVLLYGKSMNLLGLERHMPVFSQARDMAHGLLVVVTVTAEHHPAPRAWEHSCQLCFKLLCTYTAWWPGSVSCDPLSVKK